MVDNVEGFSEVDKQGTNIALVIDSLQPLTLNMLNSASIVDMPPIIAPSGGFSVSANLTV